MRFSHTTLFKRSYRKLKANEQERVDRALRLLGQSPQYAFHPGLSVHKLGGVRGTSTKKERPAPEVWEMHASDALPVTFQYEVDEILLRNCGPHEQVLRCP